MSKNDKATVVPSTDPAIDPVTPITEPDAEPSRWRGVLFDILAGMA